MECSVLKKNGDINIIKIAPFIFNLDYNEALVHQLIVSYIWNSHIGVKKHKSRSEVRGGGKKPWKQKGSGRARVGSIRSPLWKGGGKIFAAKGIMKHIKKINKKVYKLGMKMILSQLFRDNKIKIIYDIDLNTNKTKDFLNNINFFVTSSSFLLILESVSTNIYFATKNLKNICVICYNNLNPFLLLKYNTILITQVAIKNIEECFK